ncbi:MAG: hypothetical protein C4520_17380 [Candidatus Abyssobacteria bacterium SURF_5]|uniref:Esterase n=1 Tax=Abyssobacteria bacterium (strain SURF_5) TaxID=2093360 RepID=A0A3A4NIW1_ABYX5|nr:MAG: hypothetical protein C4520_17380 [Candidatus Abyssubacteria bacterium SURF_5]
MRPFRKWQGVFQSAVLFSLAIFLWPTEADGQQRHSYSARYGRRTNVQHGIFHSQQLNQDIEYSIYLPPSYYDQPQRCYPILYYIHGFDLRGKAHMDWVNWHLDATLDALITEGAVQEMIVVIPESFITGIVVDWGVPPERSMPVAVLTFPFRAVRGLFRSILDPTYFGSYLFIHRWNLEPADYAEVLIADFIPFIEKRYRAKEGVSHRAISGFSTGGYSSLSIAFRHPELFDSVSAHTPMLVPASPFSAEARDFFIEYDPQHVQHTTHQFIINLLKRIFINEETWDRHDPLTLASRQHLENLPTYIDVAELDKRGYDIGTSLLVQSLLERNVPVEFELVRGLPPHSNHTYPGYLNGRLIAELANGKTDEELNRFFNWRGVAPLINPDVQRIEYSLRFHSREFSQ